MQEREVVKKLQAEYTANKYENHHSSDELLRLQCLAGRKEPVELSRAALPESGPIPRERVTNSLRGGVDFYRYLQQEDGHWPGDYGGPMFLMPGLVITCYVTGCIDQVLSPQHKQEMIRYLSNHQNRDGGYGLHIEGESTMFGTCLRWGSIALSSCFPSPHPPRQPIGAPSNQILGLAQNPFAMTVSITPRPTLQSPGHSWCLRLPLLPPSHPSSTSFSSFSPRPPTVSPPSHTRHTASLPHIIPFPLTLSSYRITSCLSSFLAYQVGKPQAHPPALLYLPFPLMCLGQPLVPSHGSPYPLRLFLPQQLCDPAALGHGDGP